jgi:hypothetical protein
MYCAEEGVWSPCARWVGGIQDHQFLMKVIVRGSTTPQWKARHIAVVRTIRTEVLTKGHRIMNKCQDKACRPGHWESSPLLHLYYSSNRPRSPPTLISLSRSQWGRFGNDIPSKSRRPNPAPAPPPQFVPRSISSFGPCNFE